MLTKRSLVIRRDGLVCESDEVKLSELESLLMEAGSLRTSVVAAVELFDLARRQCRASIAERTDFRVIGPLHIWSSALRIAARDCVMSLYNYRCIIRDINSAKGPLFSLERIDRTDMASMASVAVQFDERFGNFKTLEVFRDAVAHRVDNRVKSREIEKSTLRGGVERPGYAICENSSVVLSENIDHLTYSVSRLGRLHELTMDPETALFVCRLHDQIIDFTAETLNKPGFYKASIL